MDLIDPDNSGLLSKTHLAEVNSRFEKELQATLAEKLKQISPGDDCRVEPQNDTFCAMESLKKAEEHGELTKDQQWRNRRIIKECKKLLDDVEKIDKTIQFVSERIETLEKDLTLNNQELKKMAGHYKKGIQKYSSTLGWEFQVQESENPKELHVIATSTLKSNTSSMLFIIDRDQKSVVDWNLMGESKDVEKPSDYKECLKRLMHCVNDEEI